MRVKVTERSALVQVAASTQQLTSHAGLVLVRELAAGSALASCSTGDGEEAQARLLAGAGDPRLVRDADRRRRVPRRRRAFARRFGAGASARSRSAGADDARPLSAPLQPRPYRPAQPGARRAVRAGASAARSGDGDARPGRDLHRAPRPGRPRQGTRGTYKGKVCWHPLLCFVGETGEWLHAKLRNGHAAASTGATRFLTSACAGCPRRPAVSARRRGLLGPGLLRRLERKQITYAVGAPLIASVRSRIGEIAEADWQPSCYRDGSEVASFRWRPKSWKQERRFIVRRDPAEAGEQLTLEGREWHYWALVTNDSERTADELERWHRAKANLENQIKEAKLGLGLDNLPCQSFHANWAYLLVTLLAFNLLAWLKLLALPERERTSYAKRLRFRFIAVAGTVGRSGRRLVLRLSAGYPLLNDFVETLQRIRGLARAPPEPSLTRNRHQRSRRSHLNGRQVVPTTAAPPSPATAPARPPPKSRQPARLNRLPQDPGN